MSELQKLYKTEDYWAVWLGLGIVIVALVVFAGGASIKGWAVAPGEWSGLQHLASDFAKHFQGYLWIFLVFGVVFTVSMAIMGHRVAHYLLGFAILFVGSLGVFYLAGWKLMSGLDLGAPLLALIVGVIVGNAFGMPEWFKSSLRTEYYIKTGIVLLGATLPLTLIFSAGPIAFLQATLVSVTTWLTIFLVAVKVFKLDPRFGAVLGAGGAVCGVSASIAVGGAVKAHKDHVAISIAVVTLWAIIMVFALSVILKFLVPSPISPGEAGAWVGTSEFADAAGFAVVAELSEAIESGAVGGGQLNPDDPINTFTLMKVIGRDIWIGLWCLILAVVSVVFWERNSGSQRAVGAFVLWERFPKFVLGFFAASVVVSIVVAAAPANHIGRASLVGTFKSKAEKIDYEADFSGYRAPPGLAERFGHDPAAGEITFQGQMTLRDFEALKSAIAPGDPDRRDKIGALKQLRYKSDWFESELQVNVISPVKKLRSWAFVICFLCIGLSTRFKDLMIFGLKPFWAFTIGVMVNVPLGYFLSTVVFSRYWSKISEML